MEKAPPTDAVGGSGDAQNGPMERAPTAAATATRTEKPAPESKDEDKPAPMVSVGQLLRYQDGWDRLLWATGIIAAVGNGAQLPAFTLMFGHLLDSFHPGDGSSDFMASVSYFALVTLLVGIASWVTAYLEIGCLAISGERQIRRIREAYAKAVLYQDMAWFDKNNVNQVVTKVNDDATAVQGGIGEAVGMATRMTFTSLCAFAVGFAYSWQLTLLMIGTTPIMAWAGAMMMKMMGQFEQQSQQAYAIAGGIAEEHLRAVRTVQALGAEQRVVVDYDAQLNDAMKAGVRKGIAQGGSIGFTSLIMFLCYSLAFWIGSLLISHDRETTMEQLVAAGCKGGTDFTSICADATTWEPVSNTACWQLCSRVYDCLAGYGCHSGGVVVQVFFALINGSMAIGRAAPSLGAIATARVAAKRVYDVVATARAAPGEQSRVRAAPPAGTVKFNSVSFAYPTRPDHVVLRDFTAEFKAGTTVALVGRSGCGKSTIVALLERFYQPTQGSISIGGVDLANMSIDTTRDLIGLVSQEPVLFSGTIRDNIAFGASGAVADEAIRAAAAAANATEFIESFEHKYETVIGQGGKDLSGGQKQRIAIARALIRNPAILILDEATSALDSQSEAAVQTALDGIVRDANRLTIVIAHRLSTIKAADLIMVLQEGRVAETGSHAQLMDMADGIYRDLVHAQESGRDGTLQSLPTPSSGHQGPASVDKVVLEEATADAVRRPSDHAVATAASTVRSPVSVARILRLGAAYKLQALTAFFASVIQGLVLPGFSYVFAEVVTVFFRLNTASMLEGARFWAGMFVIVAVVCGSCYVLAFGYFALVGQAVTRKLRTMSLAAMLNQDMAFHDQESHSTGALTTRLSTDATLVNAMANDRFATMAQNTVTVAAALAISFASDWRLTLVVLATSPLMFASAKIQMAVFTGATKASQSSLSKAGTVLSEAIHGIRTVQAFNLEPRLLGQYNSNLLIPLRAGVRAAHISGIGYGFSQFVMFFCYGLAFYVGGIWVSQGSLTFNDMLRVLMVMLMSAMAVGQSLSMAADVSRAQEAAREIFTLLDTKPLVDAAAGAGAQPSAVAGALEFRNVSFTYPSRSGQVLSNFNLSVPAGSTIAIVGASGSGKSTLVQLLMRYYQPTAGSIVLDGVDIAQLNVQWLRKHIGVVSQEPVLFRGTVAHNIGLGKHTDDGPVTQQQLEAAARQAFAHDFIMHDLPHGYDSDVSSTTLSGGQKQRIAIARALVRNPSILLLDEATSALDARSEEAVQQALDALLQAQRRTTLLIAHRLSTIKHADHIIVMDHGHIIQQGTHDQLICVPGRYQDMWQRQSMATPMQQ